MAVITPAGYRTVIPHTTGVVASRADGRECAPGWEVPAPASNGAIIPHPACVPASGTDGYKGTIRRGGLAKYIVAPAGDGVVVPQPTSVGGVN